MDTVAGIKVELTDMAGAPMDAIVMLADGTGPADEPKLVPNKLEERDRRLRSSSSMLTSYSVVEPMLGKLVFASTGGKVTEGWPLAVVDSCHAVIGVGVTPGGGP